jgi:ferric-dicitrate binding protein FerR (iron transport regulator)
MNQALFHHLLQQYLLEEISAAETQQLFALLEQPFYQALFKEEISRNLESGAFNSTSYPALAGKIKQQLAARRKKEQQVQAITARMRFRSMAVAAAVLLCVAGMSYWLISRKSNAPAQAERFKNEVAPGSSGAELTLANGQKLLLDTMRDGVLITENGLQIKKLNGQISYSVAPGTTAPLATIYNTVTTRTGKHYAVTLSDGTKVWLNAGSSLRYPIRFEEKNRMVTITGEAYFEVAHAVQPGGQRTPFTVQLPDSGFVNVTGTHFNVNAYHIRHILTSLLEGSVQLERNGVAGRLLPGQGGAFDNRNQLDIHPVNTDKTTAWVNNDFHFDDDSLEEIMEQLSRWYGIEVSYQSIPGKHYSGMISRNAGLTQVLGMFEDLGYARFTIDGNKVTVMQAK